MNVECLEGIPCPKHEDNPCCCGCADYDTCDFEDKCSLNPETCGNDDYKPYEERKV